MRTNSDLLHLPGRRLIYEHIQERPGSHLREIQRNLSLPLGTLEYHLYRLERSGLVSVRQLGRFKAFFAADSMDRLDKTYLYFLRRRMPWMIARAVVNEPWITFQSLSRVVPISPSTLSFHLQKLRKAGILIERRVGREKAYSCEEPARVAALLDAHRPTATDQAVDSFAETWLSFNPDSTGSTDGLPQGESPAWWRRLLAANRGLHRPIQLPTATA